MPSEERGAEQSCAMQGHQAGCGHLWPLQAPEPRGEDTPSLDRENGLKPQPKPYQHHLHHTPSIAVRPLKLTLLGLAQNASERETRNEGNSGDTLDHHRGKGHLTHL